MKVLFPASVFTQGIEIDPAVGGLAERLRSLPDGEYVVAQAVYAYRTKRELTVDMIDIPIEARS